MIIFFNCSLEAEDADSTGHLIYTGPMQRDPAHWDEDTGIVIFISSMSQKLCFFYTVRYRFWFITYVHSCKVKESHEVQGNQSYTLILCYFDDSLCKKRTRAALDQMLRRVFEVRAAAAKTSREKAREQVIKYRRERRMLCRWMKIPTVVET